MLITLIVFIAILGLLVFVHELGHFLAAKRAGIRVEEFAFGFRPRLFAKKIGQTTYAINLIPLGGYVRMYGENPEEVGPQSYRSQSPWSKFLVIVAGPVMNLILAWLLLTILFASGFNPIVPGVANNPFVKLTDYVSLAKIGAGSPAEQAGLQNGDGIISVEGQKIATSLELVSLIDQHRGRSIKLEIKRGQSQEIVQLTPRLNPPAGQGALGVEINPSSKVKTSLWQAPLAAVVETVRIIGLTIQGVFGFVGDLIIRQQVSDNVTGIIGVSALTGAARRLGIEYLTQLVMMISVGLGVINLAPILPLDGGHIAALAYEKVTRRPLSEKQLGILATIGLSLVMVVFVVVSYKDIIRFGIVSRLLNIF